MITSFALSASFGSFPSKLAPEGQVLIRDSYLFENAKHSMTGFAPASGGPHKLVVVLTSTGVPHDAAFAYRRISLERTVAMQGHGAVIVEYPDFESYPDSAGAAEFAQGKLAASRAKVCADEGFTQWPHRVATATVRLRHTALHGALKSPPPR